MDDNFEERNASGEEESDMDNMNDDMDAEQKSDFPEKRRKPGIIYLSSIPEGMNVSSVLRYFSRFGAVGRTYLVPVQKRGFQSKPKKFEFIHQRYSEGWIEFMSKKIARRVAEQINCTQVGGKMRSKSYSSLWNIKYLPRFKWNHLSERLNYENEAKRQQMKNEINQVKKEAEHFQSNIRKAKKRKAEEAEESGEVKEGGGGRPFIFMQNTPIGEGGSYESSDDVKQKSKKTKKGRKSKEKSEDIPAPGKSAKSKKGAKNEFIERSPTSAKKSKRSPTKSEQGQGSAMRRRSGDTAESGGSERSTFLRSLFGGGS